MATQTGSIDLTASNGVKLMAEAGFESIEENYATKGELDVQADRIGMVVANNDASSSLQLTADAMTYIGNNVTIKGTDGTSTVISGGQIQTGSLSIGAFDSAAQSATLNSKLSVGGRNLLKSSDAVHTPANYNAHMLYLAEPIEDGVPYILQLWNVDVSHTGKTAATLGVDVYYCGGTVTFGGWIGTNYFTNGHADRLELRFTAYTSGATVSSGGSASPSPTNALAHSTVVTKTEKYITLYNSVPNATGTMNLTVGKWKLEKGTTPTDWTPAQEDVDTAISDAAKTATSYVTEITGQNGIMVHPSTDQTTGVQITSDVDILRDGTSVINVGENDAIRIGANDNVQMLLESDGLEIDNEVGDQIFGIESSSSGSTNVTASLVTWSTKASVDTTARTISDSTTAEGEPIVTATVNGTDYTLESTHVTTTVTAGTGVTVALTSDGVSYVQGLMVIEVDEDDVETIAPCELSVEYQRAVTDVAVLGFAGNQVVRGSGIGVLFTNDEWSSTNKVDTYFKAINEVTAKSIAFGVGASGQNRGIWDYSAGSWLIHRTESDDTVINGPKFSVAASGNVKSTYQVRVTGNGTTAETQKQIALRSNNVANRGLFDESLNKWIMYRSLAGNDHLVGGKWYVDDPYNTSTNFKLGDPQRIVGSGSYKAGTSDTMGPNVTLTAGKWLVTGNWSFTNTSSNSKRLVVGLYRSSDNQAYTCRVHTTASSSSAHRLEVVDIIVVSAASDTVTLYGGSNPASTSASTQWVTAIRLS